MASIYQRTNNDGSKVWRAVIRLKGHPSVCEHFSRKQEAEDRAKDVELQIKRGVHSERIGVMGRIIFIVATFLVVWSLSFAAAEEILSTQEIDALVQETLKEWGIPGIGLAVIYQGHEVRVAGYGVKRRRKSDPVTKDTLFQIASLTKAFTAASAAMLVEEGKLQWEVPIINYLPSFQLKDDYATKNMTLRDLLSGRTGLPGISKQCWRLWWHVDRSSDELIRRLKEVDFAYPFRAHFSYNNMAYLIGSRIVEAVSHQPWPEFCEKRIFKPLGMTRTTFSYARLSQDLDVASAHLNLTLAEASIPWENWGKIAAAGGCISCASDMALWLRYCLSPPSFLRECQKPQGLMEVEGFLDPIGSFSWPVYSHEQPIVAYGYGWMIYSLDNKTVLFHTGLSDGMQAFLGIVPEEHLGIAILTNEAPQLGAACLFNALLDQFLHRPKVDWHAKAHAQTVAMEEAGKAALEAKKTPFKPSLPLEKYVGHYEHPAYGTLEVSLKDKILYFELFTHEKGVLDPWGGDQFKLLLPSTPWLIEFGVSRDRSGVTAIKVPDFAVFKKSDAGQ